MSKPYVVPPSVRSWVPVAADSHFPIQNLPFGLAAPKGRSASVVVAIGDQCLDLTVLGEAGLISDEDFPILDSFIELDRDALTALRGIVCDLLREDNRTLRDDKKVREKAFVPQNHARLQVPVPPPSFVDFYSGIHHASNVGKMFRPDQPPLLPNFRHLPVAYNGRASSVVKSGTPIVRPKGQFLEPGATAPVYEPSRELDFELELGVYVNHGQEMGKRITCSAAEDHMLGLVLVNDWSARDLQRWEYQPLGPFLAKSFATTVSPWIVTLDALTPFRVEGCVQDPPVLPHLRRHGTQHFDLILEVWLQTARAKKPQLISTSNTAHLYWSPSQQLAHMTSNGCPVEFGDLYASGTISGPEKGQEGSLLELTVRGKEPLTIAETGETRTFLEDGDTLTLTGYGQGEGHRIGFGTCVGQVSPAV